MAAKDPTHRLTYAARFDPRKGRLTYSARVLQEVTDRAASAVARSWHASSMSIETPYAALRREIREGLLR